MKMMDLPLSISDCRNLKQVLDLLRSQYGGRLVQDQNIGLSVEHLDDFNSLLYPHRQILDIGIRIHVQAVLALPSSRMRCATGGPVQEQPAAASARCPASRSR